MSDVNGVVKAGWEEVADTFCANFKKGKDLGAACCVYVDGHVVVQRGELDLDAPVIRY
jgi:CubicO group peptidase (beta-lactamase class C family)